MLYLAVSPGKEGHALNENLIQQHSNQLAALLPSAAPYLGHLGHRFRQSAFGQSDLPSCRFLEAKGGLLPEHLSKPPN